MRTLTKYITRQLVLTLFFSVGVFTFVLIMGQMMRQIVEMMGRGQLGLKAVGYFFLLVMPSVLSLTLPMAILAATLLVIGRMSADNEINAMRASGVSLAGVISPILVTAALAGALVLYINADLAPRGLFRLRTLFVELATEDPMAFLQERTYIKEFPGQVVYVGRKYVTREGENVIEDVLLYSLDNNQNVVSCLRAQQGFVTTDPVARKLKIDLRNVRGDLRDPADPTNVRKIRTGTTAQRYPMEFDLNQVARSAGQKRKLEDLTLTELRGEIRRLQAQGIYPAAALMNVHYRFAGAVACVSFAVIGIPLGLKTHRRETSIGIALSLGLALIWYVVAVLAITLKHKVYIYPEVILWSPNLAFEILGLWLLWRTSRV
jgi:lipopolysaccharide export system permease protein